MMSLDDYLDTVDAEPWAWGRLDCGFFGGRWVELRTGKSALAVVASRYSTAFGAKRYVLQRGGLLQLVDEELTRCGFARTASPEHGDIGVIALPGGGAHAVAQASVVIRSGPWWVGRTLDGIAGMNVQELAAWRIA